MAFYYGKIEPDLYFEFAWINRISNLCGLFNFACDVKQTGARRKILALIFEQKRMANKRGFSVTIERDNLRISRICAWNLETDEVIRFIPRKPKHSGVLERISNEIGMIPEGGADNA